MLLIMTAKPKAAPVVKRVKTSLSLPEELWRAARIRAIEDGMDAQDLVARALEAYLRAKGGRP
jgi:hypothetical protein